MGEKRTASRSITRLFIEHGREMANWARRMLRSDADADDAVQEVMLGLLRAPHAAKAIDRVRGWLFALVRGRCVDLIRGERRRRERETGTSIEDLFAGVEPAELVERGDLCRAVARAVDSLPDDLRWIVVKNELEEMTFREMSGESGVPMGTLMARKAKAMELLRGELRRQGLTG